jgi:hypothetical protein
LSFKKKKRQYKKKRILAPTSAGRGWQNYATAYSVTPISSARSAVDATFTSQQ